MAKAIPEGLHQVTIQLNLDGASDAIALYAKAFGAREVMRAPDPSGKKIWHAQIQIGDTHLFINDVFEGMNGPQPVTLWIYSEDVDAAWKRATEAGLQVGMPLGDMFWGDRMGMLVDRWGNRWTLAQHMKDLSPEQMKQAEEAFVASQKKG